MTRAGLVPARAATSAIRVSGKPRSSMTSMRGPEHLLAALIGSVGGVAGAFTHADILAQVGTPRGAFARRRDPAGPHLTGLPPLIWRALLWQRYQVSRLNIQSIP